MKKLIYIQIRFLLPVIVLLFAITSSCEDDDSGSSADIEFLAEDEITGLENTVDLGDVPLCTTGSLSMIVIGKGMRLPLNVTTTSANLSVNKDIFYAANARNSLFVSFTPENGTPLGATDVGAIVFNGENGFSKSISVTANITEPETLDEGVEIYAHGMDFTIADPATDKRVTTDIFDRAATVLDGITVQHRVASDPAPGRNDDDLRIELETGRARCPDNTADSGCGSSIVLATDTGLDASFEISFLGLEAGRTYSVSYWVRPGGSSGPRSLNVEVTGNTEDIFEDWSGTNTFGGSSGIFTERVRMGIADDDGNLNIKISVADSRDFRTIMVDDVSVKTGAPICF
ncbi:hypothetical protein Q4Q39_06630 [Flavivirga amylovorans]|uniref:CBM-cenC domain-containing protein n=1 Tax=Flavivirga amylovorans TaxID=870486 RepID=A0ABT8X002_9FLAO|nr:hypothetical protein [Flavivirga amylovorans]MDO5987082.1 hypothetical protein [Flavivirga amylovorans]